MLGAESSSRLEKARAISALGFLLPVLGGGNDFFFLPAETALAVLSLAIVGFVGRFAPRGGSALAEPRRIEAALLAVFLLWWLGNFVVRPIGPHAAMDTGGLFCGALVYVALSRASFDEEALASLAIGLVIGTVVTAIDAYYQYWIVIPRLQSWMPAQNLPSPYVAANANFYSANCYAPFLASVVLLAIGLAWTRPTSTSRAIPYSAIPMLLLALLLTKSRSSMGLLVVACVALFRSVNPEASRRLRPLAMIAASIGLLLGCAAIALVDFRELWSVSMPGRIAIWHASLLMIRDHWIVGVGVGQFGAVFGEYQLTNYYTRYPHNLFLEIFAETGIVGLLSFAGFITLALASLRWSKRPADLGSFGCAATGLLLLHSVVDIDWRAPANPILAFTLLALCRR